MRKYYLVRCLDGVIALVYGDTDIEVGAKITHTNKADLRQLPGLFGGSAVDGQVILAITPTAHAPWWRMVRNLFDIGGATAPALHKIGPLVKDALDMHAAAEQRVQRDIQERFMVIDGATMTDSASVWVWVQQADGGSLWPLRYPILRLRDIEGAQEPDTHLLIPADVEIGEMHAGGFLCGATVPQGSLKLCSAVSPHLASLLEALVEPHGVGVALQPFYSWVLATAQANARTLALADEDAHAAAS